jgi:hypothetical protein
MMPKTATESQSIVCPHRGRFPARPQYGGLTWMVFAKMLRFKYLSQIDRHNVTNRPGP